MDSTDTRKRQDGLQPLVESLPSIGDLGPEAGRVVTSCVFGIATGRWQASDRLPSVREGAKLWEVAPVTVQQAYRTLIGRGLIRSESRRGYYVEDIGGLDRNREALEALFEHVSGLVDETGLSPVGVFRYLGRLAELRATEAPECVFIECTRAQAVRHATEIQERFGLACQPLDLRELDSAWRPADGLRVVFTTAFHRHEVEGLTSGRSVSVRAVPISISLDELGDIVRGGGAVEILNATAEQGRLVADDMVDTGMVESRHLHVTPCAVDELPTTLSDLLGRPSAPTPERQAVLSMYLWEAVSEDWRATGLVHPYPYRIDPGAWSELADALALPLGAWTRPRG